MVSLLVTDTPTVRGRAYLVERGLEDDGDPSDQGARHRVHRPGAPLAAVPMTVAPLEWWEAPRRLFEVELREASEAPPTPRLASTEGNSDEYPATDK